MEGARPLAVQAEVLGERLRDAEFETLRDEVPHRPRVVLKIARGEALVGAVEEGEVLLLADDFGDAFPLLARGVNACRIVSAGVEQDDTA